jgi:hypothetical protein
MNYYDLYLFKEISKTKLVEELENRALMTCGNIFIFGDTVGKPGDITYDLKSIQATTHSLFFDFGSSSIVLHDPIGIVVNEYVIGIKFASKVEWNWCNEHQLLYTNENERLEGNTNNDKHVFKIDKNKPAFLYSTW